MALGSELTVVRDLNFLLTKVRRILGKMGSADAQRPALSKVADALLVIADELTEKQIATDLKELRALRTAMKGVLDEAKEALADLKKVVALIGKLSNIVDVAGKLIAAI